MEETLVALLTAHFLGDFLLQNKWMVDNKSQWKILLLHVGIITVTSFLLLGNFHLLLLIGVFGSHLLCDWIKTRLKDNWLNFVLDQIAHVVFLVALSYFCHDVASAGWWPKFIASSYLPWFYATQCFAAGLVVVVLAGGILIGKLTAPINEEIKKSKIIQKPTDNDPNSPSDYLTEGLENGGMYIGWLERFLTMLLILIGHPTGIGFLIAAKSILRFGEIKESRHRKLAEYIIIGTFLSFGWALLMSVATKKSIDHWLPPASSKPEPVKVIIEQASTPAVSATKQSKPSEPTTQQLTLPTKSNGPAKENNTQTEPQKQVPPPPKEKETKKDEAAKDAVDDEVDEAANIGAKQDVKKENG